MALKNKVLPILRTMALRIKYEGNPVIPNENNKYGNDFRDPKVFKFDGKWLMR